MKKISSAASIKAESLTQLKKLDPAWKDGKGYGDCCFRGPNGELVVIYLNAQVDDIYCINITFPKNTFTQEYDGMYPEYPFVPITICHPIKWDLVRETITIGHQATKRLNNLTKLNYKEKRREHKKTVAAPNKLSKALATAGIENEVDDRYFDYEKVSIEYTYLQIHFKNNGYTTPVTNEEHLPDEHFFDNLEEVVQWVKEVFPEEKREREEAAKAYEEQHAEYEAEEKKRLKKEAKKAKLESSGDASGK